VTSPLGVTSRAPSRPTSSRIRAEVPDRIRAEVPDVPRRVRPGDLWQLGPHRLLCGDCADPQQVRRLLPPGQAVDLLLTDPPYGVAYTGRVRAEGRARRGKGGQEARRRPHPPLAGDTLLPDALRHMLARALALVPLRPGGPFYVFSPGGPTQLAFRLALQDAGLPVRQELVWVKNHFALGRADYHPRHEALLYGWRPGAPHAFHGGRGQDTVWTVPNPRHRLPHPTVKPLALLARAIGNSSREGDLVFDGFGGSGSTLLACEQSRRVCRMMEISPEYCGLILWRWERETGGAAGRMEVAPPSSRGRCNGRESTGRPRRQAAA